MISITALAAMSSGATSDQVVWVHAHEVAAFRMVSGRVVSVEESTFTLVSNLGETVSKLEASEVVAVDVVSCTEAESRTLRPPTT